MSAKNLKTFTFTINEAGAATTLELTNSTDATLRTVEILTIFLKDEITPGGGPSQAHIRFETITSVRPKEHIVLSHRTWINGKPAQADKDQLGRLTSRDGEVKPYVLDISWLDDGGKTCFQRIPVGH